jgi:hypothetical protein
MDDGEFLPKLIVHAVHGTWPYGFWAHLIGRSPHSAANKELPWFIDGSPFQSAISTLSGRQLQWIPFMWSGTNSFTARRVAATSLVQHLQDWFHREPEAEHVIIAHSHGGSVSVIAARALDAEGNNLLTEVITLATPFARIKPSDRDIRQLAARYMVLRFGWLPIVLFCGLSYLFKFHDPDADPVSVFVVFGVYVLAMIPVTLLFLIFWRVGLIKFRAPDWRETTFCGARSWALYAIRAPRDEATVAIGMSQFIDLVSDILFIRGLLAPFDWLRKSLTRDTWGKRLRLWLILGTVLSIGSIIVTVGVNPQYLPKFLEQLKSDPAEILLAVVGNLIGGLIGAPILVAELIAVAFAFVALVGPLIIVPATAILAMTLGGDVMKHQGLMQIECEPIPSGITGTVSTVDLSDDERTQLGLVHFIHVTQAARSRVADLLKAGSSRS